MNKEYDKFINKINRFNFNNNTILELKLINYEGYNLYIKIDYNKPTNSYKLLWYDLDYANYKNIKNYVNTCILDLSIYDVLFNIMNNQKIIEDIYIADYNPNVYLNINLNKTYSVSFKNYIPKEIEFVSEIFAIIFDIMPKKIESFFFELIAEVNGTKAKYEYNREIEFDLFKDKVDKLFPQKIIERGKEYYNNNKVIYLEKIEDTYYACVEGKQEYFVKIKYNEKNKKVNFYCSCPYELYCKHIYAVLMAIRNKYKNKFFKVVYKNENESVIEIIANSKYFLSIGISNDCILIVNNNRIEAVPLLDQDGKCYFRVLEDDDKKSLSKKLLKFKKDQEISNINSK